MFPIILDISALNIVLIGNGSATERRLKSLEEAGCNPFCHSLNREAIIGESSKMDRPRIKDSGDDVLEKILEGADIVFIGDLDYKTSKEIRSQAKAAGVLVNVEDRKELCDFHVPSMVRSGDLLITTSTAGKSPRLARKIREKLEGMFKEDWEERLDFLAKERTRWKKHGAGMKEVAEKTDEIIKKGGWL